MDFPTSDMASDILYDEYAGEEFDLNGEFLTQLTGGIINNREELYLQDPTQCQDTSSSDSGISAVDDQQDVANITDLNNIFDTDFKDLDLSLDYDFSTFIQDLVDPDVLVKTEPQSPSSCSQHDDIFHDNLVVKDEVRPMALAECQHDHSISSTSSVNSPQNTYTIKLSSKSFSPHYDSSSSSPLPLADHSFGNSADFTYINSQSLKSLQPDFPSNKCSAASTSPTTSIIIMPGVKKEGKVSILPSSQEMLIVASGDIKSAPSATNVNINSILNSKVKIQPKPGSEVTIVKGNSQWGPTKSQVALSSYQPLHVRTSSSPTSDGSIIVGTDDKYLKRAQRIIKNRESASLSRKKKKEYLNSLEVRLQQCRVENERLLKENESLKHVLKHLQQENSGLKNFDMSPAKKICLMCVVFLLVLNLSPFSFMNEQNSTNSQSGISPTHHITGRHLMSLDDDRSSRTFKFKNSATSKKEQWPGSVLMQFSEELSILAEKLNMTDMLGNMCPMYFNSTESNRMVEQLRTWMINHEEEKKKTERKQQKTKKNYPPLRRFDTGSFGDYKQTAPSSQIHRPTVTEHNYPVQVFNYGYNPRHRLLHTIPRRNDTFYILSFSTNNETTSSQIQRPVHRAAAAEFSSKDNSSSGHMGSGVVLAVDYFLVPATAHNKTMRPRMSLLMPVVTPSVNESTSRPHDNIGMMQIDCEILSTNIINIHRSAFPGSTQHNSTSHQQSTNNNTSTEYNNMNLHSKRAWNQTDSSTSTRDSILNLHFKKVRNQTDNSTSNGNSNIDPHSKRGWNQTSEKIHNHIKKN